jgi:hypothetical protein
MNRRPHETRQVLADQSAPAAFDPDPAFGVMLIAAFIPLGFMTRAAFIAAVSPDPTTIIPYPVTSHPEKVRAGRRGNGFGKRRGQSVLFDHVFARGGRTKMIVAITAIIPICMVMTIPVIMTDVVIAITPIAIDPNPAVIAAIPVARHPNHLGSRTAVPMASDPDPMVSIPCPAAFHPKKVRAGRRTPVFISRRRRSFAYDDDGSYGYADADVNTNLCLRGERCA